MNQFEIALAQLTDGAEERQNLVNSVERSLQPFVTKVSTYAKGQLVAEFTPTAV